MDTKDIITSIAAVVGMLLGIYNFFHARAADRVKLRVVPKAASYLGNSGQLEVYSHNSDAYDPYGPRPPDTLSLEILNLSKFTVTIDEVGLLPPKPISRMALSIPIIKDGKSWPRTLAPRESVLVYFDTPGLLGLENIGLVKKAYASTVCGTTCYGRSRALKDFVQIARGMI